MFFFNESKIEIIIFASNDNYSGGDIDTFFFHHILR